MTEALLFVLCLRFLFSLGIFAAISRYNKIAIFYCKGEYDMCGIVGFTGRKSCLSVLLEGLHLLEYRGYDSAGVSFFCDGDIRTVKAAGRLSVLRERLEGLRDAESFCGIGHTRWATHGAPTDINSHPHCTKRLSLVHNGIIENHRNLSIILEQNGYSFISDTDTERAAKLIDMLYTQRRDPIFALFEAQKMLVGSYAFAIVFKDIPDKIFAMRKDSPLIVGESEDGAYLASDIPAILPYTAHCCRIEEGVVAELSPSGAIFYAAPFNNVLQSFERIDWNADQARKDGFEHFMYKEILEEPDVLRGVMSAEHRASLFSFEAHPHILRDVGEIRIIACGTAMHAGLIGKAFIEKYARIPVGVEIASEFRYGEAIVRERTLFLFLSQSGETADTVAALRKAKAMGAPTLALVNVFASTIAREADEVIYTMAGPEIAVASTKAYSLQCALLALLAIELGQTKGRLGTQAADALCKELGIALPSAIEELFERSAEIERLSEQILSAEHLFYIGRGVDYALALEASLKLKEISYIHSEAYPAGELKHGTISLICEGTPVVAVITDRALAEKSMLAVHEVSSRGARVISFASGDAARESGLWGENIFVLPDAPPSVLPILAASALQLFAYFTAAKKGLDVDKPRNLAKSVTVE